VRLDWKQEEVGLSCETRLELNWQSIYVEISSWKVNLRTFLKILRMEDGVGEQPASLSKRGL